MTQERMKLHDKTYDRSYFDRWYRDAGIGGRQRLQRKVSLAVATAEYHLERPIRSVLDIGCGEGAWRAPLLKMRPKLRYLGFDSSDYAVQRYGPRRNLHFARFGDFDNLVHRQLVIGGGFADFEALIHSDHCLELHEHFECRNILGRHF